jgi:hypothetical protein
MLPPSSRVAPQTNTVWLARSKDAPLEVLSSIGESAEAGGEVGDGTDGGLRHGGVGTWVTDYGLQFEDKDKYATIIGCVVERNRVL